MDISSIFSNKTVNAMLGKLACFMALTPICVIMFWLGEFSLMENYFPLDPWIDTRVSENYNEEKFNSLKIGDSKEQLIQRIGYPLRTNNYSATPHEIWYYTNDGRCGCGDFAWFERSVVIDSTDKIIKIRKQIYSD